MVYDIDPQVLKVQIPALAVQPLVENAVRHGITPKRGPGTIEVIARLDFVSMRVVITVRDDGVGIPGEKLAGLLRPGGARGRGGVGLSNIHERLTRADCRHRL